MASYSGSLRRDESYTRPREDYYLSPTTGSNEPRRRRSRSRHGNDPRDDYPPPLPPDTGPPSRRSVSRSRKRPAWPPRPSCEDEVTALSKEAGTQQLLKDIGNDEVQSRGSKDQEPIIEDVPEFINERRFVLSSREKDSSTLPTPPTSEDEKTRKANRRPSKLNMNFNKVDGSVPEMSKRTASPYAFTKSNAQTSEETSGRFLSPDSLLSPPPIESSSRKRDRIGTRSQPTSPVRDSTTNRPSSRAGSDYFSISGRNVAAADAEADDNRPRTYPPSRELSDFSRQTSVVDFATQSSREPIRKMNLDARRNTDTESTLPTLPKLRVDRTRRPTPLTATTALSELDDSAIYSSPTATDFPPSRSRESSYVSSRGPSPASSIGAVNETPAPARSPRTSLEYSQDYTTNSSPASRTASVSGSRPSSPSPRTPAESPRLPKTEMDWSSLLAANATRRTKAPPRGTSLRQESTPVTSRVHEKPTFSRVESLPYPVDDGPSTPSVWMPSERTHQWYPDTKPSLNVPLTQESKTLSRAGSPSLGGGSFQPSGSSRLARPSLPVRHSTSEVPQADKSVQFERPKANEGRRVNINTSSQAKKDLQVLVKRGLPTCPRTTPVAGYSDWYTLVGAPNLDFCPDCIEVVFDKTIFRNSFRRSPPLNLNTKVQCALGGMPWIRLAWLLTLQQQRTDLTLLKDLAEIEETAPEPCPGDREAVRSWFGLRDSDGMFVKNFYICYSDVRKIERLLPTLNGLFVRLPYRGTVDEKHLCAIRPEGNRFSAYIDALISAHESAMESRKKADPSSFIELVKWRQRLRECSKDNLMLNGLWHFIPSMPELTVCEDCYETVVEPEVRKNNDLAIRFNRTVQPVYGEGIGSSCQLYSRRMRKVFQRAVQEKDLKYLARKAKERREAEMRLQEKYRHVIQKAKRLSWEDGGNEDDERRLDREIRRITAEWQSNWE